VPRHCHRKAQSIFSLHLIRISDDRNSMAKKSTAVPRVDGSRDRVRTRKGDGRQGQEFPTVGMRVNFSFSNFPKVLECRSNHTI
jgi:hypothetical protein